MTQFVVMGEKGVVILKTVNAPSLKDFDGLIRQAQRQAKAAGIQRKQLQAVVSGDKHLLDVSGFAGIEVIRPGTFVRRYLGD